MLLKTHSFVNGASETPFAKQRRSVRRKDKLSNLTIEDIREMNEVTKRNRGISRLTHFDLFRED